MIAYSVTAPQQYPRMRLRLFAQTPSSLGDGFPLLKTVLQTVENGHPIAESPAEGPMWLTLAEIYTWIEDRRSIGWVIEPDVMTIRLMDRVEHARERDKRPLRTGSGRTKPNGSADAR